MGGEGEGSRREGKEGEERGGGRESEGRGWEGGIVSMLLEG